MDSNPLPEEIEAGQKAWQRIVVFERNRWRPLDAIFCFLVLSIPFLLNIKREVSGPASVFALLCLISVVQYQYKKRQIELDFAYLRLLKRVYGEGVYEEVKKEPHSFYYYIFQKRYWPDRRPVSLALP